MALTELEIWNRALGRLGDFRVAAATALTGVTATAANPIVATKAAHGYATGDFVLATGFTQMTQLNGRIFKITVLTANTFSLDGEDGSTYTAETTGGRTAQLVDTNGGAVGKQAGVCFDAWRGVASQGVRDKVLRAHPWNAVEKFKRLARLQAAKTITGATAASPVVITAVAHGYTLGDRVLIENVGGMVELNDRFFTVGTVPTANTFQLANEDGTTHTAYTSGGTAKKALTPLRPDFGYAYRYDLPSDCLHVLEVVDDLGQPSRLPWKPVGRELYADDGILAPIRYSKRELDVTRYDALLVDALESLLAHEMAEELTQNTTKRDQARKEYEDILKQAKRRDAQEGGPNGRAEDDWNLARVEG